MVRGYASSGLQLALCLVRNAGQLQAVAVLEVILHTETLFRIEA